MQIRDFQIEFAHTTPKNRDGVGGGTEGVLKNSKPGEPRYPRRSNRESLSLSVLLAVSKYGLFSTAILESLERMYTLFPLPPASKNVSTLYWHPVLAQFRYD
jgi:hypothetical protein